jgi:hypothetical protein
VFLLSLPLDLLMLFPHSPPLELRFRRDSVAVQTTHGAAAVKSAGATTYLSMRCVG